MLYLDLGHTITILIGDQAQSPVAHGKVNVRVGREQSTKFRISFGQYPARKAVVVGAEHTPVFVRDVQPAR
jgi:hypothetical protein